ncbi:DUF3298 and DUF4163 domain-containing protein [uncultured Acetobacteroides sp.]|uniref:DUF3298 and DUF4163 domain-containing protein n=1 Tax=uncultured Acetobacteroides sp. TaxID=1760811 RepID=UPI0029F55677|nr:DUF3298 and DUF4163 domain-containing protein [uncultured Acetobacteroides sp.]
MRLFIFLATSYTLLLNIASCTSVNGGSTANSIDTIKYEYRTAKFVQESDRIKDSSLLFRSSITFPLFDKKQNAVLADSINTFIRYTTFGGYQTAEEAMKTFVDESIRQTKDEEGLPMLGWESMDSITVISNTPSVVSLRRKHYSFTGGAHGNPSETYTCFSASRGKRLRLEDVAEAGRLSELEAISIAQLKQDRGIKEPSTLEESGLFVAKDELPLPASFALTRQGLLMAYDYYEIASYADGVISYTIPYSKLKGILKPEFILSE